MQEIINSSLIKKKLTGDKLTLFFGESQNEITKVIILEKVVAFTEIEFADIKVYILQVREGQSVYGLDMSLKLKRPEYADYKEVFLFVNNPGPDFTFRALAEEVKIAAYKDLTREEING